MCKCAHSVEFVDLCEYLAVAYLLCLYGFQFSVDVSNANERQLKLSTNCIPTQTTRRHHKSSEKATKIEYNRIEYNSRRPRAIYAFGSQFCRVIWSQDCRNKTAISSQVGHDVARYDGESTQYTALHIPKEINGAASGDDPEITINSILTSASNLLTKLDYSSVCKCVFRLQ